MSALRWKSSRPRSTPTTGAGCWTSGDPIRQRHTNWSGHTRGSTPNRSGGWILFAQILAGFGRYAEATTALRKAERVARSEKWREPPDHRFAVQWGFLYQEKKDFRRAELSFRRAVALHPSATNLTRLAEVLVSQGRLSLAKRHLERAIRIGSGDPDVTYYQLGLIARARGQYAEALKHFDAAIHYSVENPSARTARRDVKQAIKLSR